MKRYIQIALLALIVQSGLSNVVYAMDSAPTTTGEDSIVNAIKQSSDLTQADVSQYKLLRLKYLDRFGGSGLAFLVGAASTIGAGVGAYQQAGAVQAITPERIPGWMTNPIVLAGLGFMGTGYVSYKLLYPRIKEGILNKVEKLENIYNKLQSYSIGQQAYNIDQINSKLPTGWAAKGDIAVYNALVNLIEQGECASALLGQIQFYEHEENIKQRTDEIDTMIKILKANKDIYEKQSLAIQQKKQEEAKKQTKAKEDKKEQREEEYKEAKTAEKKASAALAKAKKIETYGGMFTNTVKNIWHGLNSLYENKEKIFYQLGTLSLAGYGAYAYIKYKYASPQY